MATRHGNSTFVTIDAPSILAEIGPVREHKRFLREHLGNGKRKTRIMKVLALLVESGTAYCFLLVICFPYS